MAKKQIRNQDIFSKDLFAKTIKEAKELVKVLDTVEKNIKDIAKVEVKALQGNKNSSVSDLKKRESSIKRINSAQAAQVKIEKQRLALETRLKAANSEQIQGNVLLNEQLKQQNQINRNLAKEQNKVLGAYTNLSARLNRLRKEYKDLAAGGKENTTQARRLRAEIQKLDGRLKSVDRQVGQNFRNVGNYSSALGSLGARLKSLASAFGVFGGSFLFVQGLRKSFNIIKDFNSANAELAGVLGTTIEGVKDLQRDATRLGGTTVKTATQVTKLQTAFARLGFQQNDIINLTEATIEGSVALRGELDETAELVGALVNSFDDFETQDSPEIIDQLTLATQRSALNFEKLQTALPIVAGAANAAGVPFTRLLSLLGQLANAGIDTSSSATALRNIFIEAAGQGRDYKEILEEITASTDSLTEANDNFGKRAAVSANILANTAEKTEQLDRALQKAAGTAKQVAETELQTLDAKLTLLGSAYEGFVLSIENGEGRISQAVKGTIGALTGLLNVLTEINTTAEEFAGQTIPTQKEQIETLVGTFKTTKDAALGLGAEIVETQKAIKNIADLLNSRTAFDKVTELISPVERAKVKSFEEALEQLRIRLELLFQARKNLGGDLFGTDSATAEAGETDGGAAAKANEVQKERIDLIEKEAGLLAKLEKQLEIINAERERILGKGDASSNRQFAALTTVSVQLELQIEALRRILSGEAGLPDLGKVQPKRAEEIDGDLPTTPTNLEGPAAQLRTLQELVQSTLLAISQIINDAFETRIANINDELQVTQRRTDELVRKAQQERLTAQESIAFERKQEAELERDRQRLRKQQQTAQAFFTVLQSYSAAVQSGSQNPIGDTIRDVTILRTLAQSFASAYEGTDDTGGPGKIDSKGGNLWVLHPNEQVWSKQDRAKVGFKSREEIINIVQDHNQSLDLAVPGLPAKRLEASMAFNDRRIVQSLAALRKEVGQIDQTSLMVDSLRNILTEVRKKGNKVTRTHSKLM